MSMREKIEEIRFAMDKYDPEVVAAITAALAEAERVDADYQRAREAWSLLRWESVVKVPPFYKNAQAARDILDAYFGREVSHE